MDNQDNPKAEDDSILRGNMTTKDLLIAGRARIERGWCQGTYARDDDGVQVYAEDLDYPGLSFCALGAIGEQISRCEGAALILANHIPKDRRYPLNARSVSWFNDDPSTTKEDVLALYDRAIAAC